MPNSTRRRRASLALAAFAVPTFLVATASEALTPSLDNTQWHLTGTLRGRIRHVGGARDTATVDLSLNTADETRTFSAVDDESNTFTGDWLYGNRPGTRIKFDLDAESSQTLDDVIAGIIADRAGISPGDVSVDARRTKGTGSLNPRKRRLSIQLYRVFRASAASFRRSATGTYKLKVRGYESDT